MRRRFPRGDLARRGYSYDSDAYDDELPYWVKVGSRDQLVVPYSLVHNDVRFSRQGITTGSDYFDYVRNAVECVIEEDPPRMLSFGLHNRIIAHPGRAFGLAKALDWLEVIPRCGSPAVPTSRRTGANGTPHRARPNAVLQVRAVSLGGERSHVLVISQFVASPRSASHRCYFQTLVCFCAAL